LGFSRREQPQDVVIATERKVRHAKAIVKSFFYSRIINYLDRYIRVSGELFRRSQVLTWQAADLVVVKIWRNRLRCLWSA
jgi:hypothetical protein